MPPRTVLITGCSTGIGHACAERLARAGHTVYATARRLGSVEDLAAAGCRTLALDVTDEASMTAAVATVEADQGAVKFTFPGGWAAGRTRSPRRSARGGPRSACVWAAATSSGEAPGATPRRRRTCS